MNKYYVWSGSLQKVLMARDATAACIQALEGFRGTLDSRYFIVDEPGFRTTPESCTKDGEVFEVVEILELAGYVFEKEDEEEGC